jgi:integrase
MDELQRFLYFLEKQGIHSPTDINKTTFAAFLKMLAHVKPRTLSGNLSVVRSFLHYLLTQGLVSDELIDCIPSVRTYWGESIPAIWTAKDLKAILNAVDKTSPLGKRDYAILLLAARLGLRVGDIRTLRLEELDWDHAQIHVSQAKTGVPLELPLLEDVGQALIDYLRHGRPVTSRREVFLRHIAPFEPFAHNNSMHTIISKYRCKARIKLPDKKRCGLHSLRHTLASRLLEADTPVDVIAGVLGHVSPETTRLYLKVDIKALRSVALDPEEVFHETE